MPEEVEFLKDEKNLNLDKINNKEDLTKLCEEFRRKIITVVSRNGGHLASNLGVVELTVALHKVFSSREDRIIWDVGHQCYVHKMLTGRLNKIDSLRTKDGLSGFTNRGESSFDAFTSGHSSTSIAAALGLACAKSIQNKKGHTVAVIGDGALTGGLAYEGLNNAGKFHKNFIVVLNDNDMSISKNVGAISRYLKYIRIRPSYTKIKAKLEKALDKIPLMGGAMKTVIRKVKYGLKSMLYNTTIFEDMGFLYYGPVDGHDIAELMRVFNMVKKINRPILVHVVTTKGKGHEPAEKDPKQFHGMPKTTALSNITCGSNLTFSSVFGKKMCELAEKEDKLCAITAAMASGTGLSEFAQIYKNRFFDVGIAEQCAVTLAGGLAAGGMVPVFAVYSSFLQRGYDQIIHDVAIQNLKVIFAIDRAGFVGEDGETHQGLFDVAFLNSIPNVRILAPSFFDELKSMLQKEVLNKAGGAVAIRYPKGPELFRPQEFKYSGNNFDVLGNLNGDIAVVTYGRIFSNVCLSAKHLKPDKISIIKLNTIKPIDKNALDVALKFKKVFFFEEALKSGSAGEVFGNSLLELGFKGAYYHHAVEDTFVKHMTVSEQIKEFSLDAESIAEKIALQIGN